MVSAAFKIIFFSENTPKIVLCANNARQVVEKRGIRVAISVRPFNSRLTTRPPW